MATILITGTSKGIGFETALAFARAGHQVFATMRAPAHSPRLAETAATENLSITISRMDVDSDTSVQQAIAAIQLSTPIDVLINNAGVESVGSVEEQPFSQFRAVMETNYFGSLRCIQAVLPSMRQRATGCILNVSSIAGRIAAPPMASYAASKYALEALTEVLAAEVKPFNIRVALIEPGIIDTAMAQRISTSAAPSPYPHAARFAAMFQNSLQQPVPPAHVAQKILDIYTSGTQTLRYPVGPDAAPFLALRSQMSDDEWVALNAADDATFFATLAG